MIPESNSKLNKQIIQQAYINAVKQNLLNEVLSNIFQSIKANKDQNRSSLVNQQINQNIARQFVPATVTPVRKGPLLDPKAVYPLNKAGGIGGVLYRNCIIVDKGIEQRQGNNAPKLKQIVDFKNAIQTEKSKNNDKLQWLKQSKQYPFRIILLDKQKKSKAIYFKTRQEADKVRIHYICKFLYKGNFNKLMQELNKKQTAKIIENFRLSLNIAKTDKKAREQLKKKKQNDFLSAKNEKDISMGNKTEKAMNNYDEDAFSRMSKPKTEQGGYNERTMKDLLDKDSANLSQNRSQISKNIISLQQIYKRSLFDKWLSRAREEEGRQIQDPGESLRSKNIKSIQSKSMPASVPQIQPSTFQYLSIELLNESNMFIKPIVTLSLYINGTVSVQSKFNTIIKKKQPFLNYQLVSHSGPQTHTLKKQIQQYEIGIKVIDYLSNSLICNDKIKLKNKIIQGRTLLLNDDKSIRLEIRHHQGQAHIQPNEQDIFEDDPEGSFLQIEGLSERHVQQIRGYWDRQSIKRGYYNTNKDIRIIEILELSERVPKFWSFNLSQQSYKLISILSSAEPILKFKLTQSVLPMLNVLQKLYTEFEQLIQVCLSLLTTYMRPYFVVSEFNKLNKLHTMLGLEGDIELSAKISLQMQIIQRIICIECKELVQRFKRKNIGYVHALYQYLYEMFATNFKIKILAELWNFLFKDVTMIPIYLLLIAVWLVKFYSDKLNKCNRLKQFNQVLTSKQTCSAQTIIRQIVILREKYLTTGGNLNIIDSIKEMFNTKPLEQVIVDFYKRQTKRLDLRKQTRHNEKTSILQKLCSQSQIQLPNYPHKTYTLHIYFYKLPPVSGSLYIKANNIQYECLNASAGKYFIIGDVSTEISLQFINNKSDEYSCKLQCMQGVNRYMVELTSPRDNSIYRVEYLCGLLTDSHIDMLKKNKKFQHFIGTYVKQNQLFDELLRPINECSFLNIWTKRADKDDLGKKIKVQFSSGSKNFDEIQFYLKWIAISPLTLPQKLKLLKDLAANLSHQYFLSNCLELYKILVARFLSVIDFQLSSSQLKCYYSDSLNLEFKAPKIIKCRLIFPNGTEQKLESIANSYLCLKSEEYLYEDIVLPDLISFIQKQIESTLNNFSEGMLHIVYSSFGEVKFVEVPITKKKTSKDIIIDDSKYQADAVDNIDISTVEPEILFTQILPTFSKISTILDFVNQSKSIQSLGKNKQHTKNVPQAINLLKNCNSKFNKILLMRFKEHPSSIKIPFLSYYHELICEPSEPTIPKNLFLNNLQTDIKTIITYKGVLQFSDNKRIESVFVNKQMGLHGNFRILPPKTQSLYFATIIAEEQIKPNAELFVNYGFGTYRWEPCTVLGYYWIIKDKETNLKKQKKPKKSYLVIHQKLEKICRDFQLRMNPKIEQSLRQISTKTSSLKLGTIRKPGEMTSSKKPMSSSVSRRAFQQ